MSYYFLLDASGRIDAVLNDEIDTIPDEAIAVTQQQVDTQQTGKPYKFIAGELAEDIDSIRAEKAQQAASNADEAINKADLTAVLMQLSFAVNALIEVTDVSGLSAARQARLGNIKVKLVKLVKAYRDRQKAKRDVLSGAITDISTIPMPDIDSFDD